MHECTISPVPLAAAPMSAFSPQHTANRFCFGIGRLCSLICIRHAREMLSSGVRPLKVGKECSLISSARRHDYITPVLATLHRLPVRQRVIFKTAVLVWKCLRDAAPRSQADLCADGVSRDHKWNANYAVSLASVIIAFRGRLEAFSSDLAPSASKMAAKTISGSGFDHKFGLSAPGFLI